MEDVGRLTIASSGFILFYTMIAKHMHDAYHIPDPMVMMLYGIVVGRAGFGLLQTHYAFSKVLIFYAARLLLSLQTMAVALSLPGGYLHRNKLSLFSLVVLSGFIKCGLIFLVLKLLSSLSTATCWAIAASLTPTDPILSSSIIKGSFARAYVPEQLRTLLAAESGINDGLGIIMLNISIEVLHSYHNIFDNLEYVVSKDNSSPDSMLDSLSIFGKQMQGLFSHEIENLINDCEQQINNMHINKYCISNYVNNNVNKRNISLLLYLPIKNFVINTIGKKVLLSSVIGYVIGYVTRKITQACCAVELVRSEVLLTHSFVLTFLGLSLMDQIDGSELICIFFIGTALNADSWYSLEGSNRRMSELVEGLFSNGFFIFMGSLLDFSRMPLKLFLISIGVIVFCRPASILPIKRIIPLLNTTREALFIGWFGPIGVGALYYCILYDSVMDTLTVDFAMCIVFLSTIIHGVSVPIFCLLRNVLDRH